MRICLAKRPYDGQSNCRNPDPNYLTSQNVQTITGKESRDAQGRSRNGTEWKQIARIIERREEGNTETAVSEGIEKAVRGGGEEEIQHEAGSRGAPCLSLERDRNDDHAERRRKD